MVQYELFIPLFASTKKVYMATTKLGENEVHTNADFATKAFDFKLVNTSLQEKSLADYAGKRLILNIFPSIDTATCATSVRTFNKMATDLANTTVLCISRDLPFAQKRFCGAEGIENVETLSDFRDGAFGKTYGVELIDGALKGLHARAIVVLDDKHAIIHTELVNQIADEPNYETALASLK